MLINWIAQVSAQAAWVTSVCTGALLRHGPGPARGRRVATHHGCEDSATGILGELERLG